MLTVGFYMLIVSYGIFYHTLSNGHSMEYARTAAVNIFVFVELFYLFSCKELETYIFKINILNNKFLLLGAFLMIFVQVIFTNANFMNMMFKSQSLDTSTWVQIILISSGVVFVVDIKRFIDKKLKN